MKRLLWLVVILSLGLSSLTGCDMSEEEPVPNFDTLARHTPAGSGSTEPFFLNLKPGGETARHWERLRRRLEGTSMGQEALQSVLGRFQVEILNLEDVIEGPAVSAYWQAATYVILEVTDEAAAREAMMASLGDASAWEQEAFEDRTIYYGRLYERDGRATYLAWTTADGLLLLTYQNVDRESHGGLVANKLKGLLGVTEEESVAALAAWQALDERLPEGVMGVSFISFGQQSELPPADAAFLFDALSRSLEGAVLALVPEEDGLRVEIDGVFDPQAGTVPALQALFDMPAIDEAAWENLPAGTAIALAGHDALALLPWLQEMFGLRLDVYQQAAGPLGLDVEADLLAEGGPLEGALALGILPPLADQPTIAGITTLQLLVALPEAGRAQGEALQRAMESRGAVFGPQEVEGVEVQAQVGTAASGYAVAYGYDDGVLYLGSSPQVVSQGIAAQHNEDGMGRSAAFQAVLAALPEEPTAAGYVQTAALSKLIQANTSEEQHVEVPEYRLLELFEAIGLGLRLEPERLYGVLYLRLGE